MSVSPCLVWLARVVDRDIVHPIWNLVPSPSSFVSGSGFPFGHRSDRRIREYLVAFGVRCARPTSCW